MALMDQQAHLLSIAINVRKKTVWKGVQTTNDLVQRLPTPQPSSMDAEDKPVEDPDPDQSASVLKRFRDSTDQRRARGRGHRYSARLRPWYVRRIWDIAVTRAYTGWDIKIRSYMIRPASANIFTYDALGESASCRKLIERGLASPFDVAFIDGEVSPTHLLCVSLYIRRLLCPLCL